MADTPPPAADWSDVDELVDQQKLEAATPLVRARLDAARQAGDEAQWTKALVKLVQLRMAQHGYETAVRLLKEEPWPQGLVGQTTLSLFYADAVVNYVRAYSWEIRKREATAPPAADAAPAAKAVDLKALTLDQLYAEALGAYQSIWARRAELQTLPASALGDALSLGNYPAGIRDTLRDVLVYAAAGLLADSSLWRTDDASSVYRLSAATLAGDDPERPARLDDATMHPLARLAGLLADHERWHAAAGRRGAALEARLQRVRALHGAIEDAGDRALLVAGLGKALDAYAKDPWWAMGQATLADLYREAGDLVAARDAAARGAAAYPGTAGGDTCQSIVATLEAPAVDVTAMSADAAQRRSLVVKHKNLPELHFRAWRLDALAQARSGGSWSVLPDADRLRRLAAQKPDAAWTEALPATPDLHEHRTFVTPKLEAKGLWVIEASPRADFARKGSPTLAVTMVVSDLVLQMRSGDGRLDVTVVRGVGSAPVPGATVELYAMDREKGDRQLAAAQKTDAQGTTTLSSGGRSGPYALVVRSGGDVLVRSQAVYLGTPPRPESEGRSSFIYTDRSVYRPGQTIAWKVVAYAGDRKAGALRVEAGRDVEMTLRDANGEVVAKTQARTNAFGSAAGQLTVPTGRLLGGWTLGSSIGPVQVGVRVEEYKRPTFEVTLKDPATPLRLGKKAPLSGEARYYFGAPVTAGRVRWRVVREPVYPYWWWWTWRGDHGQEGAHTVATGESAVDADGGFALEFLPEADERVGRGLSYLYHVTADLTDDGGETRSAARSFRIGFASVEATIVSEHGYVAAGAPAALSVVRTTLDGAAAEGSGRWRLVALVQPDATHAPADLPRARATAAAASDVVTPGDLLRERWSTDYDPAAEMHRWADGRELAAGELTHAASDGTAKLTLPPLEPGAYRIRYETTDAFGDKAEAFKEFVVAGDGKGETTAPLPLALPLALGVRDTSVAVGGTAQILVHSGLKDQTVYLDIFKDGRLERRRRLAPGAPALVDLPVARDDRGGFAVVAWTVADHQLVRLEAQIDVPWSDKRLALTLETFRDTLRPGDAETWTLGVKGDAGDAVKAEVLAYMYDRSLDLFAPHSPPEIARLYRQRAAAGYAESSVQPVAAWDLSETGFPTPPAPPALAPARLVLLDGYGVGGMGRRGYALSMAFGDAPAAAPKSRGKSEAAGLAEQDAVAAPTGSVRQQAKTPPGAAPEEAVTAAPAEPAAEPRSNFAETAFFLPQLVTDARGRVAIEFKAPDSVTSWAFWVHALTKDLRGGSLTKQVRTVKELMVRPYLPRFLREGDKAELRVVVNNTSAKELSGQVELAIAGLGGTDTKAVNAASFGVDGAAAKKPFTVAAGGSTTVVFSLQTPRQLGLVSVDVRARAGDFADGERRPLPILPSRMHLAESRFAALRGAERKLVFEDRKQEDATRVDEQLVVSIEPQLFYGALKALPYLVEFPYECAEQTLNRFVSTAVLTSLFKRYPAAARMAEKLAAKRDTAYSSWNADDPNRKLRLEETPWVEDASGKADAGSGRLARVLMPDVARAQVQSSLATLRKLQSQDGGFPWFPGGRPTTYMTLYVLHGLSRALEVGVDVPKDLITRAWRFVAADVRRALHDGEIPPETGTFLVYVASAYRDPSWMKGALTPEELTQLLDASFKSWRDHSPYLKAYLALALKRADRAADARLVFDSVMDSAKTDPDLGTYWAPEDRSWLWYNDTVETHAFALRTLMELDPKDARRDGLVTWLFLNRQLDHWKSTRATAEALYALARYLDEEGTLATREALKVTAAGRTTSLEFAADDYAGKTQIVVPGPELQKAPPEAAATVTLAPATRGLMFASATWHYSTDLLPATARGDLFKVERRWFRRNGRGKEVVLEPLAPGDHLAVGDELEVQLAVTAAHAAEYVQLRDPRAAGLEPDRGVSAYRFDLGLAWYEEVRDSATNFFFEALPAGEYTLRYRLRASAAGVFRVGPATLQSMYAPEFTAFSAGQELTVAAAP
jgi:uncharacterized protein YfaS (alpha-2-macroglobulin family)